MQNGAATLEESSVVSYQTKLALAVHFSNHTLCYLLHGAENLCLHQNLHVQCAVLCRVAVFIMPKPKINQDVFQWVEG